MREGRANARASSSMFGALLLLWRQEMSRGYQGSPPDSRGLRGGPLSGNRRGERCCDDKPGAGPGLTARKSAPRAFFFRTEPRATGGFGSNRPRPTSPRAKAALGVDATKSEPMAHRPDLPPSRIRRHQPRGGATDPTQARPGGILGTVPKNQAKGVSLNRRICIGLEISPLRIRCERKETRIGHLQVGER